MEAVSSPVDQAYDAKVPFTDNSSVSPGHKTNSDGTDSSTSVMQGASKKLWYWSMAGFSMVVSMPLGHLMVAVSTTSCTPKPNMHANVFVMP